MTSYTAALIQKPYGDSPQLNRQSCAEKIREAAAAGAKLVVLSELHNSLYFCQSEDPANFDLAEPVPGPSTDFFGGLSREFGIVLIISLFERRAAGIYHNTAVVLDCGSIAGIYRKMHIPDDPLYYEKFYFTPGDLGFVPAETSLGKIGVLVCWDQWYPEAARLMAMKGADILVYPTAIGWDRSDSEEERFRQREAWITVQRAHAIANGLFVLSCNRTGFEANSSGSGIDFWGGSFVAGPQGEILTEAAQMQIILYARIDYGVCEKVRRMWPFFRDRRIDAYDAIVKRFDD